MLGAMEPTLGQVQVARNIAADAFLSATSREWLTEAIAIALAAEHEAGRVAELTAHRETRDKIAAERDEWARRASEAESGRSAEAFAELADKAALAERQAASDRSVFSDQAEAIATMRARWLDSDKQRDWLERALRKRQRRHDKRQNAIAKQRDLAIEQARALEAGANDEAVKAWAMLPRYHSAGTLSRAVEALLTELAGAHHYNEGAERDRQAAIARATAAEQASLPPTVQADVEATMAERDDAVRTMELSHERMQIAIAHLARVQLHGMHRGDRSVMNGANRLDLHRVMICDTCNETERPPELLEHRALCPIGIAEDGLVALTKFDVEHGLDREPRQMFPVRFKQALPIISDRWACLLCGHQMDARGRCDCPPEPRAS